MTLAVKTQDLAPFGYIAACYQQQHPPSPLTPKPLHTPFLGSPFLSRLPAPSLARMLERTHQKRERELCVRACVRARFCCVLERSRSRARCEINKPAKPANRPGIAHSHPQQHLAPARSTRCCASTVLEIFGPPVCRLGFARTETLRPDGTVTERVVAWGNPSGQAHGQGVSIGQRKPTKKKKQKNKNLRQAQTRSSRTDPNSAEIAYPGGKGEGGVVLC